MLKILYTAVFCLLLTGCARNSDGSFKIPFVYRIDIQQGNVIEQSMINQLKPGMTMEQVRFIMGTPLLIDPFHSDRWEYLYSYEPGDGERQQRHITLYFRNDVFSHLDGDIKITDTPTAIDASEQEKTVVVPIEKYEKGFFARAWDTITFSDDEKPASLAEDAEEEAGKEAIEGTAFVDETPELDDEDPDGIDDEGGTAEADSQNPDTKDQTARKRDSEKSSEETERDRRNVEIFEKAGGQF